MKFYIKDFFSECDQIRMKLQIWSHLLKKSLKSDSHLPKLDSPLPKIFFICFNDSHSKMMKNAFYFILKTLFVLKILNFLSWPFGHVEKNGLIRKTRLISKVMTSQPGKKQWQYTYCSISHELNATRQWTLVS